MIGSPHRPRKHSAFTLIELLIVITVIAILIGLLFPAFKGVQDQAKRVQAKNDLTQIVTAVNAFYTEYGKYPSDFAPEMTYDGLNGNYNNPLFDILKGRNATANPRTIVFLSPPVAKDLTNPRAGISQAPGSIGQYMDPWGKPYIIRLDTNYDNAVTNPYSKNAGFSTINQGVIAWSFGRDRESTSVPGPATDKNADTDADDIISWQ